MIVTSVSAVQTKETCKSAFGNFAAYSIVCDFIWCMEVLKEALYVICIGITVGKKGIWIPFCWMEY